MIKVSLKNQKLGKIASFSVPAELTCPGVSEWCLQHCYASTKRMARFTNVINSYNANYAESQDSNFVDAMIDKVQGLSSFRMHVAGDFYSAEYIQKWVQIVQASPGTKFWAYTRSWTQPDLLPALETLRALPNMQLFASWDNTMAEPPATWRIATIGGAFKAYDCPEQTGRKANCADCGYCFRGVKNNVRFSTH